MLRTESTYEIHYIQSPDNSQSFNRYAYCLNNPLKYTDPSGWKHIGAWKDANPFHDNWSASYSRHAYEPRDFRNAANLWNMMLYGNLLGPGFAGGVGGSGCSGGAVSMSDYQGTYGYHAAYQPNSVYNYTFPSSNLQLIRNWQYAPNHATNSDIREAGITDLTVGVVNYGNGSQSSSYTWKAFGKTYSTEAVDYVGSSEMDCYSMTIQPLGWYGEGNRQLNKANLLAQCLGVPLGAIENSMNCAAKAYHNVSVLTGRLTQPQYVEALTKVGNGTMKVTKLAGGACFAVSAGAEVIQMYNYRNNGGQDYRVYIKGGLDIAMGAVGLLGPIGLGISMTYFVIDITTDGFNGWGAIPY